VLGAALREGDEANAVPPASEPEIAGEELVEFGVSDAAEALEIGLVERFIRACWIECQIEVPSRDRVQLRQQREIIAYRLQPRHPRSCTTSRVSSAPAIADPVDSE